MLPCFICGRNAETGWIKGFPPAPDSQKLALCVQHNTKANRQKVEEAWQNFLSSAIDEHTRNKMLKSLGPPRSLSIFFVGGGGISVPCTDFQIPDPSTLKVFSPTGETLFFPLRQVKHYLLSAPGPAEDGAANAAGQPGHADRADYADRADRSDPTDGSAPVRSRLAAQPEKQPLASGLETALKKLPPGAFAPEPPAGTGNGRGHSSDS